MTTKTEIEVYPLSKLIADLQAMLVEHGDLPVSLEGCDCVGYAKGVIRRDITWPSGWRENDILIERVDGLSSGY